MVGKAGSLGAVGLGAQINLTIRLLYIVENRAFTSSRSDKFAYTLAYTPLAIL